MTCHKELRDTGWDLEMPILWCVHICRLLQFLSMHICLWIDSTGRVTNQHISDDTQWSYHVNLDSCTLITKQNLTATHGMITTPGKMQFYGPIWFFQMTFLALPWSELYSWSRHFWPRKKTSDFLAFYFSFNLSKFFQLLSFLLHLLVMVNF